MDYKLKLKTGFYESTFYNLHIINNGIGLFPIADDSKEAINLSGEDISYIILSKSKYSEIEIKTVEETFNGIFNEQEDLRKIHSELKRNIKSRIIYKEE